MHITIGENIHFECGYVTLHCKKSGDFPCSLCCNSSSIESGKLNWATTEEKI